MSNLDSALPVTHGRLLDFPDDPIRCMRRLHATHGELAALEEEGQRIVFIFSPSWNQRVLSDAQTFHSRFFAVRGPRNSAQRRLTSGLLSMNGDEHRNHRRMVMAPFQKKTISGYHEAICQLTGELLDSWNAGDIRDMHAEMTAFMLRVTSGILFGLDQPELAFRIGEMTDRWVHLNHNTGMGAFVSDSELLSNYDDLLALADRLEADIQQMIDVRRTGSHNAGDVLSLLIRAHDDQAILNDQRLVGHAALLFGAAHLTTAHSLTWTLFLLAQHPEVMRELAAELEGAFTGDFPALEDVGRLPLLERVIKESMRVLPASGYSQRIAAQPVALGPFQLSPGAPIVFSQFMTHHSPELYSEPESFRPDRWRTLSPSPYAYLPFGNGPRMCIGGPLAMQILKTALPMILRRYRLQVVPGAAINAKIISTMLGPTTPVAMSISAPDGRFAAVPCSGNIHELVDLPQAVSADSSRRAA